MARFDEYDRILTYVYDYAPSTDRGTLIAELLDAGADHAMVERAIKEVADAPPPDTVRGCLHNLVASGFMLAGLWSLFVWSMSGFLENPADLIWSPFTALGALDFVVPLLVLSGLWARWQSRTLLLISGIGWGWIIGGYVLLFFSIYVRKC